MTQTQRNNISRGLKEARRRRRLSEAMKASWVRRRTENAPEVRNNNHKPSSQSVETSQRMLKLLSEVWQQGYDAAMTKVKQTLNETH